MAIDRNVVFVFKHYEAIKQAIYEKRMDPATQKQGGGGHSYISDPTAQKALRNASELEAVVIHFGIRDEQLIRYPERWLKVADRTRLYFSHQIQGRLIELAFDQGISWREICKELCLRRGTYYTLMNDVLSFACGVAIGLGLSD